MDQSLTLTQFTNSNNPTFAIFGGVNESLVISRVWIAILKLFTATNDFRKCHNNYSSSGQTRPSQESKSILLPTHFLRLETISYSTSSASTLPIRLNCSNLMTLRSVQFFLVTETIYPRKLVSLLVLRDYKYLNELHSIWQMMGDVQLWIQFSSACMSE